MNKYLIILFLGLSQIVYGQDKLAGKSAEAVYKKSAVMKSIRTYMKAANYSKVLDEINTAFKKYDDARKDPELYSYEIKALEQLALVENKNMYLANKADTAKYFTQLYNMYEQAMRCDSIESQPDLNGNVTYKYRYGNAPTILKYRRNLKVAGKYFYRKKDYKNAYRHADLYYRTKSSSIFTDRKGINTLPDENDNTETSVIAVLSAYGSQNNRGVVTYLKEAMKDSTTRYQLLELGCKSYFALGDTAQAVELLHQGFTGNPSQEYFFMSLIKYYNDRNDHDMCLRIANDMVTKFPDVRNYWFIKATEEESLHHYDDAIASLTRATEIKKDDAEAYSTIAAIYTAKAQELYNRNTLSVTSPGYKSFRENLKQLYSKSKEAYENARKYAPDNKALWLDGLRNTYFRLNMGRELKELEK